MATTKKLKFKKMHPNAIIPTRGSDEAAGVDLYACIDTPTTIYPGETYIIGSGVAFEPPKGYFGVLCVRSSVGIKEDLGLANQIGIIDADFKSEIMIALHNHGNQPRTIEPNQRIAQLVLLPYLICPIEEIEELSDSIRGENGIGSTGKF